MNKIQSKYGKTYQLQDVIGLGSFGRVYKSSYYWAVKQIILPKQNSKLMDYLKTEIKILTKINHPNLLSAIDVIQKPPYVYIVMNLCQTDLQKYIKNNKIDQNEAQHILKQILAGFKELNKNSIVHRDLKPGNILLTQNETIKISDFGLAKFTDGLSQSLYSQVGTRIYMAPQVLNGEKYTSKCDIWSIGIIYYQLLTGGNFPWYPHEVGKKLLKLPENISAFSKDILKKMLEIDQKNRIGWDQLMQMFFVPFLKPQNFDRIRSWLHKSPKDIKPVFKASQYNFSMASFHQICGDKPNLIIIALTTKGKILGGYTPLTFNYKGQFKNSADGAIQNVPDPSCTSFIFSLSQNEKYKLIEGGIAINRYRTNEYSINFGGSFTIYNQSDTVSKQDSYFIVGTKGNYDTLPEKYPQPFNNEDKKHYLKINGNESYRFKVKEWEAYQVFF